VGAPACGPVFLDSRADGHRGRQRLGSVGCVGWILAGTQRRRLGRGLGVVGLHARLDARSRDRIRGVGRTLVEPPVEALLESPGRTPELRAGNLGTGTVAPVEVLDG